MKFYVVSDAVGSVIGCERSLRAAHKTGVEDAGRGEYVVDLVVVEMSPGEAMRRMLGNLGGFAAESRRVFPVEVAP